MALSTLLVVCALACGGATAAAPKPGSGESSEPAVVTVEAAKPEPADTATAEDQDADRQAGSPSPLERFTVQAVDDAELREFVSRLLQYCRAHGSRVEIRVHKRRTQNLDLIDDIVRKSGHYSGPALLPAQYFGPTWEEPRDQRLLERLRARLQRAFSPKVVQFVVTPPLDGDGYQPLAVPTLVVSYAMALNGGFTGQKVGRFFMGITADYRSRFTIPGEEAQDRTFSQRLWRAPDPTLIDDPSVKPDAVYEAMATSTHDEFTDKWLARWFEEQ